MLLFLLIVRPKVTQPPFRLFPSSIPQVWPLLGTNKQSTGELLLGFFKYYSEVFEWTTKVVTIRAPLELTKVEKEWDNKPMAVEGVF